MGDSSTRGWVYSQSSGRFTYNGNAVASGYSGIGAGKNNPGAQSKSDLGPVPQGRWSMGLQFHSLRTGPGAMRLTPLPGTQTYGRDGFEIHGDSIKHPGAASSGCIILAPEVRRRLAASPDRMLTVVP